MTNRRTIRLLRRYLDGTASLEEAARVEKWWDAFSEEAAALPQGDAVRVKEELYGRIREVLGRETVVGRVVPLYKRAIFRVAAAACLIGLAVGGFLFVQRQHAGKETAIHQSAAKSDIAAPAHSLAILILADGKQIALDSAASGTLASQGNSRIQKLSNGRLVYKVSGAQGGQTNKMGSREAMSWNTITVPRGSRIVDLTLADGSRVWLNSGSSLRYPTAFTGTNRRVEITGEGYFEIARDPGRPFRVERGTTEVEVLGTSFNVMAYEDEATIEVSLLDGAVRVSQGARNRTLRPGEQARVGKGSIQVLKDVDLEDVMAWKNGRFQFGDAEDIPSVMRQIARWYDVDLVYEGTPAGHVGGAIPRTANVSAVLHMLEMTGAVKFRIEGRKVFVMAGKK